LNTIHARNRFDGFAIGWNCKRPDTYSLLKSQVQRLPACCQDRHSGAFLNESGDKLAELWTHQVFQIVQHEQEARVSQGSHH
jgi:hypothetical protein